MTDVVTTGDSGGVATSTDSGSPTTASTTGSPSTDTITQHGVGSNAPGPVPYERFSEVNEKYGKLKWAEAHNPTLVEQQHRFFQWLDSDPEGATEYLTNYLTRAGALKPKQTAGPADNGKPQADVIVPETGQKFYSAEGAEKLAKWQAEQLLNERLSPIEKQMAQADRERTLNASRAEARAVVAEAETWPYYKEHEGELLKAMETDRRLSLEGAYRRVVLPKLRTLERQAVLTEMNAKPAATTVNPGATRVASERVPAHKLSMQELFRREMAKRK